MKRPQSVNRERGVALIMAMLMVLVLTTLLLAVMLVTDTEGWSTMNYRFMVQSRYGAEAGAQATINWLSNSYTKPTSFGSYNMTTYPVQYNGSPVVLSAMSGVASNYPDSTQSSAFNTALSNQSLPYPAGTGSVTYSTYATLLRMAQVSSVSWMGSGGGLVQTWQITSQGTITGKPNSVVQVIETVENTTTPIFTAGVVGIGSGCSVTTTADNGLPPIDFIAGMSGSGCQTNTGKTGPCTDSYNSNSGPYSSTNSQTSGGNIATNGFVNLGGGIFDGTISTSLSTKVGTSCPTDGVETGGGTYGGINSVSTLSAPCPWGCTSCGSTACYPSGVTPVTTNQTLSTSFCSSSSTNGCTPHSPATTTIYDQGSKTTVNQYNLAPGTYGNITINSTDVVYFQAGGTYNINSISFPQDGQIVINNTGCSGSGCDVTLNLTGAGTLPKDGDQNNNNVPTVIFSIGYSGFNLCKNSLPGNVGDLSHANCDNGSSGSPGAGTPTANPISGIPSQLQIVYAGNALVRVGGSPNSWVMYAPQSPFLQPGSPVGLYGSILCNSFVDSSNSPFHYDNALQGSAIQVNGFKLVAFTWSKY